MPFIPVNHVYKVVLNWTVAATQHPKNVLWCKPAVYAVPNQAFADAAGGFVAAALDSSGLETYLSTASRLNTVTITDMTSETGAQFESVDLDEAGDSATDYLPAQTAGMIEWITALRGPSYRGRTFIPGFTENASDGRPVAGCINAIFNFADALLTNFAAGDVPLGVVSLYSGTEQVAGRRPGDVVTRPKARAAGVFTEITSANAETVWKTQRRRSTPG